MIKISVLRAIQQHMNKGFVAIFMVSFLSFLAAIFVALSGMRVWSNSSQVSQYQAINATKYDATSCISVAQLLLLLGQEEILGTYDTREGDCDIERVVLSPRKISLITSSSKNNIKITFKSELDPDTSQLISLVEDNY